MSESEKPAIVLLGIKSIANCECSLTPENKNDKDGVSATKYNEQRRHAKVRKEEAEQRACKEVERRCERKQLERCKAKEVAKRWVSNRPITYFQS